MNDRIVSIYEPNIVIVQYYTGSVISTCYTPTYWYHAFPNGRYQLERTNMNEAQKTYLANPKELDSIYNLRLINWREITI